MLKERGIPLTAVDTHIGGGRNLYMFGHPKQLFAEHPGWFPLIHGQRQWANETQYCVTAEGLIDHVAERMHQMFRSRPWANVVGISRNGDAEGWCECEKCAALDTQMCPDAPYTAKAERFVWFLNRVGEKLEKTDPDKIIYTYLAAGTMKPAPKKVKPRCNVRIMLFYSDAYYCDPLLPIADESSAPNGRFRRLVADWLKLTDQLVIADTIGGWTLPQWGVLAANLQWYAKSGVLGVEYRVRDRWDVMTPDAWLVSQLLWNPDQDTEQLLWRFCRDYYGPAEVEMLAFFQAMEVAVTESDFHGSRWGARANDVFTPAVVEKLRAHLGAAAALAKSDIEAQHVATTSEAFEAMIASFRRFAAGRYHVKIEGKQLRYVPLLPQGKAKAPAEKSFDLVTIENDMVRVSVAPALGGLIAELMDKAAGVNHIYLDDNNPGGGYAEVFWLEKTDGGDRKTAWQVVEAAGDRLHLACTQEGLMKCERIIALDGRKVRITSKLTNLTDQPQCGRIHVHPFLNVGGTYEDDVLWMKRGGKWGKVEFQKRDDNSNYFWGETAADTWAVYDEAKGVGLLDHVADLSAVRHQLVWNYGAKFYLMEIIRRYAPLKPGETLTFEHTYELVGAADAPWK